MVVGMRLAGKDELHAPVLEERTQAVRIPQEQIGALVGRGAAGEADGQPVRVEPHARPRLDRAQQLGLELAARRLQGGVAGERARNARILPGPDVHAVGDGDDGRCRLHMSPHGARGVAVELGHGIGEARQAQPGHGHVERIAAQLPELGGDQLAAGPQPSQVGEGVDLVAGGHGGVGREDDPLPRRAPRLAEVHARPHAIGDQLDAREDGVAFVEVVEPDRQVERLERPRAADAEQHLLGDATVGPGVVEAVGDPAVTRVGGLEQVERSDGVASHAPDAAFDLAPPHADAHADLGVLEEIGRVMLPLVVGVAVGPDALHGVALRPAEADAHHRQPEVARRLHEVASQHAEPARVGVKLLVQAVLHGEVGDEGRAARGGHGRLWRYVVTLY